MRRVKKSIFALMSRIVQLDDRIQYLPASDSPLLSADVVAVRGDGTWWILDVGANDEAVDFINGLPREFCGRAMRKNIVISHFHRDHFMNMQRALRGEISLDFDCLYGGAYTLKSLKFESLDASKFVAVTSPLKFDDGLQILVLPMPSSHAKSSLALSVEGECAFLGDATYPMVASPDVYNVQILGEQIRFLESLDVARFGLSHKRGLLRDKSSVMLFLKSVYARREKNRNFIEA